jgi:deoxyribonuclease IV
MLRFGTSGIPRSTRPHATEHGIRRARELGLDCLEMSWVNGIRMSDATAERIAAASRRHEVELTAHAPYYVNLCGTPEILEASMRRLLDSARLATRCGARSLVFHSGFYGSRGLQAARLQVREALARLLRQLRRERLELDVRPELTGRPSQLGSLREILSWSTEVPGVRPYVDFSHHYARDGGRANGYASFTATLEAVRRRLGRPALERLHVHVTGIEFGPLGERRHLPLRQSRFRWRELLRALKDFGVSGWVVCESPAMEDDALLLQHSYRRLK